MAVEAGAPEACDLLVEAGYVVPVEPHGVVLEDHAVAVRGGVHLVEGLERSRIGRVDVTDPQSTHRARCTRPSSHTGSSVS